MLKEDVLKARIYAARKAISDEADGERGGQLIPTSGTWGTAGLQEAPARIAIQLAISALQRALEAKTVFEYCDNCDTAVAELGEGLAVLREEIP